MGAFSNKKVGKIKNPPEEVGPFECQQLKPSNLWRVAAGNWTFEAATLEEAQKKALEIYPKAQFKTVGAGG